MRKLRHWGSWAVLLLALGAAGASAAPPPTDDDDDAKPAQQPAGPDPSARPRDGWNPFLSKVFGSNSPKPDPKAEKDKKDDKDKKDEPAPRISTLREKADHILELETAKLFRRQAVAQRLREIAYETGDDALERKAFQLDELASQVFKERTARLTDLMERAERVAPSSSDRNDRVREGKP